MELAERKKQILTAIINSYINTGEPVGSKLVCDALGNNISPATIRNEMAALEESGFLDKPHTSAGRIPSVEGYKLYINSLMSMVKLNAKEKKEIDLLAASVIRNLGNVTQAYAQGIADLTDLPTVALTPAAGNINRMQAIMASRRLLMIIAILSTGALKNASISLDNDISDRDVGELNNLLNGVFSGIAPDQIGEIKKAMFEGELIKQLPQFLIILPQLLRLIEDLKGYDIYIGGETKMLNHKEFENVNRARAFFNLIHDKEHISSIIDEQPGQQVVVDILTGENQSIVENLSIIKKGYNLASNKGTLCVFGPMRLDYPKVLASVEYFTRQISKLLNDDGE